MLECFEPAPQASPQRIHIDPSKLRRQWIEPPQSIPQQRCRSNHVPSLHVVKRSRRLDQSLKERLLLSLQREPDRFPVLVRMPEPSFVIALQARGKLADSPFKAHLFEVIQEGWPARQ